MKNFYISNQNSLSGNVIRISLFFLALLLTGYEGWAFKTLESIEATSTTRQSYFDAITESEIETLDPSETVLRGTDSGPVDFTVSSILLYKTSAGRFGKLIVTNLNAEANYQMTFDYVTYNSDGTVYSQNIGSIVNGTYRYDLDEGVQDTEGAETDFTWSRNSDARSTLIRGNTAVFAVDDTFVDFVDDNFKNAVLNHSPVIDTNDDDEISPAEAEAFTGRISVPTLEISDLTGIEAFTNLTELEAYNNSIEWVDLSDNTSLTFLNLSINPIGSVDISSMVDLELFSCFSCELTELDVTQNPELYQISAHTNDLTSIDVSQNPLLRILHLGSNELTTLNVSANTELVELSASRNFNLTEMDVSGLPYLAELYVNNTSLTELDLSDSPKLRLLWAYSTLVSSLNLKNGSNSTLLGSGFKVYNTELTCILVSDVAYAETNWTEIDEGVTFSDTYCSLEDPVYIPDANFKAALVYNLTINANEDDEISYAEATAFTGQMNITSLSISDLTGLEAFANITALQCGGNSFATLDLSSNTKLINLFASNGEYSSIDISQLGDLSYVDIGSSNLTELDLSQNESLQYFSISNSPITSLDFSGNPILERIDATNTSLINLDASANTNLAGIHLVDNTSLEALDLRNGNTSGIGTFRLNGNTNLTCVSVDDVEYLPMEYSEDIDEGIFFTTDCSNGANDILTFSFAEQTGDAVLDVENHTIAIEVATGTDLTALEPTITISDGATISPEGAQDFSSAVTYTVTAENFDEQDWTVTLSIEVLSTETDILTFSLTEQTGDAVLDVENHTIAIEVVSSTDISALNPTITLSEGATISPDGVQDFSSIVTYTVTAEDGTTTQDWMVTVTVAEPDEPVLANGPENEFNIYPQPAQNVLNIQTGNAAMTRAHIKIYDLMGALFLETHVSVREGEMTFDISTLPSGMWLMQIDSGQFTKNLRFIKN